MAREIPFRRLAARRCVLVAFAALFFAPSPALAQVSLGSAEDFAVLAGTAVTCTGSGVEGDVGVYPGTAVTRTNCTISGTVHAGDTVAQEAHDDFLAAYDALEDEPLCTENTTLTSLGDHTFPPGVYCFNAAVTETDTVWTLDAQGDPNPVWIFRIGTGGTGALTGTGFSVVMAGGGEANNVFWWVAEAATLTDSGFQGNILAGAAITVTRGCFDGRALAKVAVTLTGTVVSADCSFGPAGAARLLMIDEDSIDNGTPGIERISFNAPFCGGGGNPSVCVNDDIADKGVRTRLFTRPNDITPYSGLVLPTGQVGDEGLFRFTSPDPQTSLQNGANFTRQEFVDGSGAVEDENNLDKVDGVVPLGAADIAALLGTTVCGVVYDSDISVTSVDPPSASLKGATLGVTAFTVTGVRPHPGRGSYLPLITVDLLGPTEANRVCGSNEIQLFVNVPAAPSTPANLLGLVNGSSLSLAWRNTFGGGAPAGLLLDVSGALSATLPLPVADTFSFAGVPGGTYTLSLRATNAAGTSGPSNPVTLTFPGPCSGTPGVPTNFLATTSGNVITVMWDPPDSGPASTSFVLVVSGSLNGAFPTTLRSISGAVGNGSYTLSVYATNPCGSGPSTSPQTVVIP